MQELGGGVVGAPHLCSHHPHEHPGIEERADKQSLTLISSPRSYWEGRCHPHTAQGDTQSRELWAAVSRHPTCCLGSSFSVYMSEEKHQCDSAGREGQEWG